MSFYRLLGDDSENGRNQEPECVPLDVWLSDLENERETLIKRLRCIEDYLVKYKKLRRYSFPQHG